MAGRWGRRGILGAVGLTVALALGGPGTATGSVNAAVVTRHYGPLEILAGQTARLNATNREVLLETVTLVLYDGLGSVLKSKT